jgi:hypothetical protein
MRGSAAFRASVTSGGALAGPWTRNLLWSRARAVPSLDLRFAENKSLTDATTGQNLVTFTRASSGTYVDSTGTLRTATTNEARFDHNPTTGESLGLLLGEQRTNLLLRSEEFDNASWTKVSATVTANNATSPSGDQTADTLIATSTVFARVQQNVSLSTGGYALSIHAKPGSVPFSFGTVEVSGQVLRLYFNASTGAVGQTMETGTISATSSSIKLANGWWRFVWIINVPTTATYTVYFTVSNSYNNPSVAIGDSLNLWGAQLEAGASPTSYIPTTTATVTRSADVASITGSNFGTFRTNLLLRSEEFDNASWGTKTDVVVTADTTGTLAPNGTATAEFVVANTANGQHRIAQTVSTAAQTYTFSVFAKAAGYNWVVLYANAGNSGRHFNLQNGTIGQQTGNANTAAIQSVGNGWYRCSIVYTAAAASDLLICNIADADGNFSFAGNNTSGIYLWGAQLETGSTATAYIPTTTAAVTVFESSWYRQDEGTVFVSSRTNATHGGVNTFPRKLSISDGTNNNSIEDYNRVLSSYTDAGYRVDVAGVNQVSYDTNDQRNGQSSVVGYSVNNFALAVGGTVVNTDSSGTIPTTTLLRLGQRGDGSAPLNGTIRRLTYWPQRLPNSTLQQITQ